MRHTQECIKQTEQHNRAIEAWVKQWPHHCKECFGAGQFTSYYDPSPPGISLGSGYYTEVEPCRCTEMGKCPRCGSSIWDPEEEIPKEPCPVCGWDWDKNEGDICPPPYECACYEIYAQSWEAEQDAYQRLLRGE